MTRYRRGIRRLPNKTIRSIQGYGPEFERVRGFFYDALSRLPSEIADSKSHGRKKPARRPDGLADVGKRESIQRRQEIRQRLLHGPRQRAAGRQATIAATAACKAFHDRQGFQRTDDRSD